jgi:hypothetical protein
MSVTTLGYIEAEVLWLRRLTRTEKQRRAKNKILDPFKQPGSHFLFFRNINFAASFLLACLNYLGSKIGGFLYAHHLPL